MATKEIRVQRFSVTSSMGFRDVVAALEAVTILIDERADGVHLSYDKMASFLASPPLR